MKNKSKNLSSFRSKLTLVKKAHRIHHLKIPTAPGTTLKSLLGMFRILSPLVVKTNRKIDKKLAPPF